MTDNTISISSKEHLRISLDLHNDPSITLKTIESLITQLKEEIFLYEKTYLRDLDNKQYQKTLLEKKELLNTT